MHQINTPDHDPAAATGSPTIHQPADPANPVGRGWATPGSDPMEPPSGGAAVTTTATRGGRGRFLGVLAAAVLAAGTGVAGFTAAGGMLGGTDDGAAEVAAADGPIGSETAGTPGAGTDVDVDDRASGPTDATDGAADPDGPDTDGRDTDATADDGGSDAGGPAVPPAMSVEQANASVVRIEATGEFVDPEFGVIEGVGSGSGFIIDGTGIAVTNNHVVAGAAFLEVYVPGEDGPRNARILATNECSDLAVIDIDGDGFPTVVLDMGVPVIGTDVYAAGYPLGDPEFTLTKGIVSKARTRGDTPLSSVDGVLEHDARINPGNSGGPLFGHDGRVIGINYQGNPATRQSFAITAADALPIIDLLRSGVSVDSIGINGQIVDLGDRYGLFVASVETGSMADRAGLVAGDVILELENVAVSTDGTMGDYCDVLRTNGSDVPLDITVLRPATGELLFGTLNGGAVTVAFDSDEMMAAGSMGSGDDRYSPVSDSAGAKRITDDRGIVSVEVPAEWAEVATTPLGSAGDLPNVSASADIDSFENDWIIGGVQLTAFPTADYGFGDIWAARNQLLDNCGTVEQERELDLGATTGLARIGHQCGRDGTASLVLFQVDGAGAHFGSGIIQVVTEGDVVAAERVLATFDIR
ncbi:MAG: trypsin-like peptidase domain-containing protein [Actinomycetota bacterium]